MPSQPKPEDNDYIGLTKAQAEELARERNHKLLFDGESHRLVRLPYRVHLYTENDIIVRVAGRG